MVDISVVDKISFKDIDIKSLRLSCQSNVWTEELNYIGVMVLKCPEGAKTLHNRNFKPGYIHMKSVQELDERSKSITLHQQCFETISKGNLDDFLVLGFSFDHRLNSIKLNSSTFNTRLSKYFNDDSDREAMEFFTPVIQTVLKKYTSEKVVGFTINVQFIPLNACLMYKTIYPNVKFEERKIHFETKKQFYEWCRNYYKSEDLFDEPFFDLSFYVKNPNLKQLEQYMGEKTAHNNHLRTHATAVQQSTSRPNMQSAVISPLYELIKNFSW